MSDVNRFSYAAMSATFWRDEYDGIPAATKDALIRWTLYGVQPGSFLQAVLANDLLGAIRFGDKVNLAALGKIGMWLYSHAPAASFGTPGSFKAWKGLHHGRMWAITYHAGVPGETRRFLENQYDESPMLFSSPEEAYEAISNAVQASGWPSFVTSMKVEEFKS